MTIKIILIALVILYIMGYAAVYLDWYNTVPRTDNVLHFSAGILVAALVNEYLRKRLDIRNKVLLGTVLVSIVALIGVLWEFYEYFQWILVTKLSPDSLLAKTPNYTDTLSDLALDILGATLITFKIRKQG